ncbi:hypothetical protein Pse7367_2326 [Thalassoporum mexicanum PCC 7367]|nr:hypothetical protein Pse7367_2326 [Pseudanabaena sp. PCC 7367]
MVMNLNHILVDYMGIADIGQPIDRVMTDIIQGLC